MKNVLLIAMACHAVNIAYCAAIGDTNHKPWGETPKGLQDSIKKGVEVALANPGALPEDQHNAWATSKLQEGWTRGDVKDIEAKKHPNLVPFEQLPVEQRAKDYIFLATVHALAAMPEPGAAAAAPEPTMPGHQAVKYVGREDHTDHNYGSKLRFMPGQTRNVPDALAQQLLRHQDLFERAPAVEQADTETAKQIAISMTEKQALDQVQFEAQALRDTINTLPTKAAIAEFAKNQFQQDLDPAKMKLDELRNAALALVDLYGPR